MKKIIFNIFLFFSINHFIISETCEKKDLSHCLDNNHKNITYPDYCCKFTDLTPNSNDIFCKTVPYSSYFSGYNNEYLNGKLYKVECNVNTEEHKTFALERCGNIYEKEPTFGQCKQYSTLVDSCCYFEGTLETDQKEQNLTKGCYWLGSKYHGNIDWAGVKLECHHKYLNYSLFYFIFCILSMIIFF